MDLRIGKLYFKYERDRLFIGEWDRKDIEMYNTEDVRLIYKFLARVLILMLRK